MKTPLSQLAAAIAFVAAAIMVPTLSHAADGARPHRIAVQVDQDDPALMNLVLNNVANVLEHYNGKNEKVEVEVVAYGPGLKMLRDDKSPGKDRIKRIVDASAPSKLRFSACGNTMAAMEKAEGHAVPLIAQASVVPSGVVRLNELQEDGWSYIRP
jgi:hypothetical protein